MPRSGSRTLLIVFLLLRSTAAAQYRLFATETQFLLIHYSRKVVRRTHFEEIVELQDEDRFGVAEKPEASTALRACLFEQTSTIEAAGF